MSVDRHAHRPWDGTPADLDAERADACRCGPEYYERGLIAPDCSGDAIFDLCDEVERLRAMRNAAKKYVDEVEGRVMWGTDPYPALRDAVAALDADA